MMAACKQAGFGHVMSATFWHRNLPRVWQQKGLVARLLWPVAALAAAWVRLRRWRHARGDSPVARLPVPVLVVGNFTVGGSGKTPLTIALVREMSARGWRVGVVSRGHGRQGVAPRSVAPDDRPDAVGDEPLLLARDTGVPVWVGQARADAARALLAAHPEVDLIICDDGLQHLALARDVEIALQDERGLGNGWLLPAGPLREPVRPVDWRVHTGAQPPAEAGLVWAQRVLHDTLVNGHGQTWTLQAAQGQPVDAVAGIGHPEGFFSLLRARGLQLAHAWPRPDHHDYQDDPVGSPERPLLCTHKDAVKLWRTQPQAWAVGMDLQLPPSFCDALSARLHERAARLSSAHGHQTA